MDDGGPIQYLILFLIMLVGSAYFAATEMSLASVNKIRMVGYADNGNKQAKRVLYLLNNFDIPIGIEHPAGECPDVPSATQWTSAIDLSNRRVYYKTAFNSTLRCIKLDEIDFANVHYQSHPLDVSPTQPVEHIHINNR